MKMTGLKIKNKCRQIRSRLTEAVAGQLGLNAGWLQNHIVNCPRCQQRMNRLGRVYTAFSLLKSQPHSVDLLMQANTKAISTLKHSLREAPKAAKLKKMRPRPKFTERCARYTHGIMSAAACIAILVLLKVGIFSSTENAQKQARRTVKQYYAKHVGQDLTDELFGA